MPSEAVSKAYAKGVFCIAFPNYMLAVQVEHDFFKAVSGLPRYAGMVGRSKTAVFPWSDQLSVP